MYTDFIMSVNKKSSKKNAVVFVQISFHRAEKGLLHNIRQLTDVMSFLLWLSMTNVNVRFEIASKTRSLLIIKKLFKPISSLSLNFNCLRY